MKQHPSTTCLTLTAAVALIVGFTGAAHATVFCNIDGGSDLKIDGTGNLTDNGKTWPVDYYQNTNGKRPVPSTQNGRVNAVLFDHFTTGTAATKDRAEYSPIRYKVSNPPSIKTGGRFFSRYSIKLSSVFGVVDAWHICSQHKQQISAYPYIAAGVLKGTSDRMEFRIRHYAESRVSGSTLSITGKYFDQAATATFTKDVWYDVLVKASEASGDVQCAVWYRKSGTSTWNLMINRQGKAGYDKSYVDGVLQPLPHKLDIRYGLYQASANKRHSYYIDDVKVASLWSEVQ